MSPDSVLHMLQRVLKRPDCPASDSTTSATRMSSTRQKIFPAKAEIPNHQQVNSTPFVRQYDILSNKWGVLLCQKEYQTNDIRRSSRKWL